MACLRLAGSVASSACPSSSSSRAWRLSRSNSARRHSCAASSADSLSTAPGKSIGPLPSSDSSSPIARGEMTGPAAASSTGGAS
ncbi:hypothetical protein OH77DRAFT_1035686 [Trametes cingulata]|nr:hypothetical protein OH77DRAFT_1035686 [Trametes cingulata]